MSNIHKNFNSRTRVGATIRGEDVPVMLEVSIHAPVWVRLFFPCFFSSCLIVSIHAPVWVRLTLLVPSKTTWKFQFTHPCGCDRYNAGIRDQKQRFNSRTRVGATLNSTYVEYDLPVSIHAPVWVRLWRYIHQQDHAQFQFTHPCGCDLPLFRSLPGITWFQFTHPCGCDRY